MKDKFQNLGVRVKAAEIEARELRAELKAAISSLPENPATKRVGESPKCFVVSSSELFARDNWTVSFHDFESQYKALCDFIDTIPYDASSDGDVIARLETVLHRGYIARNKGRFKLHPDVVSNVKSLLETK